MSACATHSLLIRADAGPRLGTGHVMRMIALAQACQDRGLSVMISSVACPPDVAARVQQEGIGFEQISTDQPGDATDLSQTLAWAQTLGARWVVLDGYHFDAAYQRTLRNAGFRVLAVDDYGHCDTWAADAVLNQNLFAPELTYRSEVEGCRFLMGTRFALLRREFRTAPRSSGRESAPSEASEKKSEPTHVGCDGKEGQHANPPESALHGALPLQRLLLTLGGADADNVTGRLLEALDQLPDRRLEIKLLLGAGNPNQERLQQQAAASSHQVEVQRDVRDMPALYQWADGVISAGGSTCWEWMFFRLPAAVVCIADNQRPVVTALAKHRLALNLGWHEDFKPDKASEELRAWLGNPREFATEPQPSLAVDGLGADRIASLLDDTQIYVRPVRASDARLWFQWANDPAVRGNGFYPDPIPWETHQRWFDRHRQSPDSRLSMGYDLEEHALGYVRLHRRENDEWEVGVAVDAAHRGKGMGAKLVHLALQKFAWEHRAPARGSTGDPPVQSGDPPDGTARTPRVAGDDPLATKPRAIPFGESPNGAGGAPALPSFVANIKPSNAASLKLFQSLGFEMNVSRSTRECCVFTRQDG